jgi:hypothetical protein
VLRVFFSRSFESTTNYVNRFVRCCGDLFYGGISPERCTQRSSKREHLLHDFDIARANAFTHGEAVCLESIDEHFDLVVTHDSCTDDVGNVIEINPLGVAMARDELLEDGRNDGAHDASLLHTARVVASVMRAPLQSPSGYRNRR